MEKDKFTELLELKNSIEVLEKTIRKIDRLFEGDPNKIIVNLGYYENKRTPIDVKIPFDDDIKSVLLNKKTELSKRLDELNEKFKTY